MNYKSHVKKKKLTYTTVGNFIEDCSDNRFNNLRLTIFDCLNNVEGLTDDDIDDPIPKTEVLDKNIGHATSWVKWQA